ncbi:MAG: ATP-binding protein [Myxococcota bacterium]
MTLTPRLLFRLTLALAAIVLVTGLATRYTDAVTEEARNAEVVAIVLHAGLDERLAELEAAPRYTRPDLVARMPTYWARHAQIVPTSALPLGLRPPVMNKGRALWLDDGVLWAQLGDGQLLRLDGVSGPDAPPRPGAPLWWGAVIAGIVFVLLLSPSALRARQIAQAIEAVRAGRLETRIGGEESDDLGTIARGIDQMTEELHYHRSQRDTFFRAVTHEMGTPLTRVAFALDMAEAAEDPAVVSQRMQQIRDQLEHLSSLSAELLEYAMESPARPDDRSRIDVRAALARICDINDFVDVEIALEWTDHLPARIDADERGFTRAIDNLVRNAMRYAQTRVIVSGAMRGGLLEIWVEDDGPGIPEAARESIFKPFARLDPSRAGALGGTGLGLAIVQRVVQRHAGSASAHRSPRLGGAAFVTRWPVPSDHTVPH